MPAIRTHTFRFDPDEHLATDGGSEYRPVRQGPSNPRARGADALAEKHGVERRQVVGIVTYAQHRFGDTALVHLDPRRGGISI